MSMLPTREQLDEQARMEQMYGLLGMNQSAPAPAAAPAAAAPAAAPAVSAEMSNLDRLNQLMTGSRSDYIRSLGTLDKIGLIGSVFKNINRPDAPDPVQARRQQEIAGIQGQMQVEQLRAAAAQRQQRANAAQQFIMTLPEAQRTNFLSLPENMQDEIIAQQYAPAEAPTVSDLARRISEATGFEVNSPQHQVLMQQALSRPEMIGLPGGGVGTIPGMSFPEAQILPREQRPDMTDAELIRWGRQAAEAGTDVELIFRQLREWGVNQ